MIDIEKIQVAILWSSNFATNRFIDEFLLGVSDPG
jgi:hypothetical protein